MKMMLKLAALSVALCLLAGCNAIATMLPNAISALTHTSAAETTEASAPSEATAMSDAPTISEVPAATEALSPVSNGTTVLPFSDIRPVFNISSFPVREYRDGCYTFCMDGKWGLMDADGTVILPAYGEIPLEYVNEGFSIISYDVGLANWDQFNSTLAAGGYPPAVDATGIFSTYYFIVPGAGYVPQCAQQGTGYTAFPEVGATDYTFNGPWLPCQLSNLVWDEDYGGNYTEPCGDFIFCSSAATALADGMTFTSTGWFFDEPMAPVKQGDKWAYIDTDGKLLTEFIYDTYSYSTYGTTSEYADVEGVSDASGGYAAVKRNGKWGILASDGTEIVPCTYDGAVNYLGNIWLKEADGWHSYALPGAPAVTLAATPAEGTTVFQGAIGAQAAPTLTPCKVNAESGLILRSGPGTEYDKLVTIPYGAEISCDFISDPTSDWVATSYNGTSGFVNYRYLTIL